MEKIVNKEQVMESYLKNESVFVQIDQLLQQGCISTDSLSSSIFKVPNHLRQINETAYEPQAISIGPYHHGKDHLKTMEVYKKEYLKMLLRRRNEASIKKYVMELEKMKGDAQRFYSEPLDHHLGDEEFVAMLLLDGCFVVELIRKSAMAELRGKDDPLLTHYILRTVLRDLLLVENQLPFFILSKLFELTRMPNEQGKDLMDMAINLFLSVDIIPGSSGSDRAGKSRIIRDVKHLLGLLHDRCVNFEEEDCIPLEKEKLPSSSSLEERFSIPEEKSSEEMVSASSDDQLKQISLPSLPAITKSSLEVRFEHSDSGVAESGNGFGQMRMAEGIVFEVPGLQEIPNSQPPASRDVNPEELGISAGDQNTNTSSGPTKNGKKKGKLLCVHIPPATELNEAGVKFQNIEGKSLFDITFDKGTIFIPALEIRDETESILRNLVAYEQCCIDISSKSKRFTEYITVMDCLINKEKDVELLCKQGVIDNWLGDHEVVAAIFNRIRDYVLLYDGKNFRYAKMFDEVNEYCNRDWNRWIANLRHNYFNTPWALISFIAAVFLLLLTVMQSVYTVLSYHFE